MEISGKAPIEEADGFSLIDVSASDDDFLLASSSEASTLDNPGEVRLGGAHVQQQSNSMELQRPRKNEKCNLRKSLAWDSAFFTSAGVLDAEELSSIIEGAETGAKQMQLLPGIQEDVNKSTHSISTVESESLILESLEADLFCDIRASIQRSSKLSTSGGCNNTRMQREGGSRHGYSMKMVNPSSHNMMKTNLASKKLSPAIQGPMKTKQGSACKQVIKPTVRSRESSSLLPRPPEKAGKSSLMGAAAAKRMSVGTGRVKLESNAAGNSKGSSVLSRTAVHSSRSSCNSSSSSLSENIRKSQSNIIRTKMDKNVNLSSSSKIRTPSRVAVNNKSRTANSNLSAYVKSTSKLSSSISPASSISEWSTESTCSTIAVNQKHIGPKPCSRSSECDALDSNISQNSQNYSGDKALDQSAKQPSTALPRPASAKQSGLRMPSPKIGFFDGVKGGSKTPGGSSRPRSALPSSLPKCGAGNPSGIANKTKLGNIAAERTTTIAGTAKSDVHLQDHLPCVEKPSVTLNVDNDSVTSSKISESMSAITLEEKKGKVAEDSGSGAKKESDLVAPKEEACPKGKLRLAIDQVTVSIEGGLKNVDISDCTNNLSASSEKARQRNKTNIINIDNLDASQDKIVSINECYNMCGSNSGNGAMETEQNAFSEKEVDGLDCKLELGDQKTKMQRESDGDSHSQTVVASKDSSSTTLSRPKQLCDHTQIANCLGVSPGRTPFAVKNSAFDIVESCNSHLESAAEALVKIETLPISRESSE